MDEDYENSSTRNTSRNSERTSQRHTERTERPKNMPRDGRGMDILPSSSPESLINQEVICEALWRRGRRRRTLQHRRIGSPPQHTRTTDSLFAGPQRPSYRNLSGSDGAGLPHCAAKHGEKGAHRGMYGDVLLVQGRHPPFFFFFYTLFFCSHHTAARVYALADEQTCLLSPSDTRPSSRVTLKKVRLVHSREGNNHDKRSWGQRKKHNC